jgi:hypothetical protein
VQALHRDSAQRPMPTMGCTRHTVLLFKLEKLVTRLIGVLQAVSCASLDLPLTCKVTCARSVHGSPEVYHDSSIGYMHIELAFATWLHRYLVDSCLHILSTRTCSYPNKLLECCEALKSTFQVFLASEALQRPPERLVGPAHVVQHSS